MGDTEVSQCVHIYETAWKKKKMHKIFIFTIQGIMHYE